MLFHRGFTFMEFLIAVAIVAILAAIAVPTYIHYTRKMHYSEIIAHADRLKSTVAACLTNNKGVATGCDGGTHGIPANIVNNTLGAVNGVTVIDGVITVVPNNSNGITAKDTYILTPTYSQETGTSWKVTGGGCDSGFVVC